MHVLVAILHDDFHLVGGTPQAILLQVFVLLWNEQCVTHYVLLLLLLSNDKVAIIMWSHVVQITWHRLVIFGRNQGVSGGGSPTTLWTHHIILIWYLSRLVIVIDILLFILIDLLPFTVGMLLFTVRLHLFIVDGLFSAVDLRWFFIIPSGLRVLQRLGILLILVDIVLGGLRWMTALAAILQRGNSRFNLAQTPHVVQNSIVRHLLVVHITWVSHRIWVHRFQLGRYLTDYTSFARPRDQGRVRRSGMILMVVSRLRHRSSVWLRVFHGRHLDVVLRSILAITLHPRMVILTSVVILTWTKILAAVVRFFTHNWLRILVLALVSPVWRNVLLV